MAVSGALLYHGRAVRRSRAASRSRSRHVILTAYNIRGGTKTKLTRWWSGTVPLSPISSPVFCATASTMLDCCALGALRRGTRAARGRGLRSRLPDQRWGWSYFPVADRGPEKSSCIGVKNYSHRNAERKWRAPAGRPRGTPQKYPKHVLQSAQRMVGPTQPILIAAARIRATRIRGRDRAGDRQDRPEHSAKEDRCDEFESCRRNHALQRKGTIRRMDQGHAASSTSPRASAGRQAGSVGPWMMTTSRPDEAAPHIVCKNQRHGYAQDDTTASMIFGIRRHPLFTYRPLIELNLKRPRNPCPKKNGTDEQEDRAGRRRPAMASRPASWCVVEMTRPEVGQMIAQIRCADEQMTAFSAVMPGLRPGNPRLALMQRSGWPGPISASEADAVFGRLLLPAMTR